MQSRDLVETLRLFFPRSSKTIRDRSPGESYHPPPPRPTLHWRRWRNTENGRGLSLTQVIKKPMIRTDTSSNLRDLVITNNLRIIIYLIGYSVFLFKHWSLPRHWISFEHKHWKTLKRNIKHSPRDDTMPSGHQPWTATLYKGGSSRPVWGGGQLVGPPT